MTAINLSEQIRTLDGKLPQVLVNPNTGETKDAPPESLGQAVAEHVLMRANTGPAMKFMAWARKLYANEVLDLDNTDFDLFQKTVDESKLFNFVKGRVLEVLFEAKKSA